MDGWVNEQIWGLTFRHPNQWTLIRDPDEVDEEESEYSNYQLLDAAGTAIADFRADSATDMGGDLGIYQYTDLDRGPAPLLAYRPTVFVFEHMDVVQPKQSIFKSSKMAQLSLRDVVELRGRTDGPPMPTFRSSKGRHPWIATRGGFFNNGLDPLNLTIEQARQFMKTERYQAMKQVLLSVEVDRK